MTRPASRYPTELELEILKVLWAEGPLTVRAVRDALAGTRDLAYTSVMTMMNIMTDKGYLKRRKQGQGYVYQPKINRQSTAGRMLDDVVERVFDGSAAAAMLQLLESRTIDEGELAALRRLLEEKSEEKP
jgi:predicted transcriptional regulator